MGKKLDLTDPLHAQNFRWLGEEMRSGTSMRGALEKISQSMPDTGQGHIWQRLSQHVSKGHSLSHAMEHENFDGALVRMMASGERLGASFAVSSRMGAMLGRMGAQKRALRRLWGPVILGGLAVFLGVNMVSKAVLQGWFG